MRRRGSGIFVFGLVVNWLVRKLSLLLLFNNAIIAMLFLLLLIIILVASIHSLRLINATQITDPIILAYSIILNSRRRCFLSVLLIFRIFINIGIQLCFGISNHLSFGNRNGFGSCFFRRR